MRKTAQTANCSVFGCGRLNQAYREGIFCSFERTLRRREGADFDVHPVLWWEIEQGITWAEGTSQPNSVSTTDFSHDIQIFRLVIIKVQSPRISGG